MELQRKQPVLPQWQYAMRVLSGWMARLGLMPLSRALWRWEMRLFERDLYTVLLHRRAWTRAYTKLAPRDGAVLIIDADNFKWVNDRLHHLEGDDALERLARVVEQQAPGCLVGRLGGDEMVVYMPARMDAMQTAERIRGAVEAEPMFVEMRSRMPPEAPRVLTVSVGVSAVGGRALELVLRDVDEACSEAKSQGRNRVVAHSSQHQTSAG